MKLFYAFLLALVFVLAASDVCSQSPAQRNGKNNSQVTQLRFETSNAVKDTLIGSEASRTTQQFDLRGVTGAKLITLVYNEEVDGSELIALNAEVSMDGITWSSKVPIDSLIVTTADADSSYYSVDLLSSNLSAVLFAIAGKTFLPLSSYPRVRLSYLSIGLAADDTMHVFPWLVKSWDTR